MGYGWWNLPMLDRSTATAMVARIERIDDESKPLWGSFAPGAMINHLRRALAASAGVTSFEDLSSLWMRHVLRWRVLWGLKRIPRNAIKLPEHFLDLKARKVAGERGRFLMQLEDFLKALETTPQHLAMHPYFGRMPLVQWARWHYLHFDHHFRQFGV